MTKNTTSIPFTPYQKLVIFILAITQFTVILDFMVMSPMGDMLMKSLQLKPQQFGWAVSGYAFSAGISGLLTAGFADRFDRKKLLLFFYTGFIVGTFFCSFANSFILLIAARIITGLFGGVIGSIGMAIITDLFDIHHRGRVMGFVQMGLGASQVLGIPMSLYIANHWGWRMPFLMVASMAVIIFVLIAMRLKPVTKHLEVQQTKNPFAHLWSAVAKRDYRIAFLATAILSIGGFLMMPFSSAFSINNLHITQDQLVPLFMVSGVCSLLFMPLMGKYSDKIDKYKLFVAASAGMIVIVLFYTRLSVTPLWEVMIFNILMMMCIVSRMIPAGALTTGIPEIADRGAFMSVSSSLQQIAGGIAAACAGLIVVQPTHTSPLEHYPTLGFVMAGLSLISMLLVYRVNIVVKRKLAEKTL